MIIIEARIQELRLKFLMNYWKIIWQAYHNTATSSKICEDMFKRATWSDRFFLVTGLIGMISSLLLTNVSENWRFLLLGISEISFSFKLGELKKNLVLLEYGDPNLSNAPPEQDATRYLIFKRKLRESRITKAHVESCFDLADAQLDIASSGNTNLRSFIKFAVGILAGFLATIQRNVDNLSDLIIIGLSLLLFAMFISIILFFIPTKAEKLKEMKYFMMLYCREISLIQTN